MNTSLPQLSHIDALHTVSRLQHELHHWQNIAQILMFQLMAAEGKVINRQVFIPGEPEVSVKDPNELVSECTREQFLKWGTVFGEGEANEPTLLTYAKGNDGLGVKLLPKSATLQMILAQNEQHSQPGALQ